MSRRSGSSSRTTQVSGGERTVQVRGYTRSNGTYVAGYARSPPRSSGGSIGDCTVQVSGYTRSNGTYVTGYMRSPPRARSGASSSYSSAGGNGERTVQVPRSYSGASSRGSSAVQVRGYTRSNGTYVAGYMRSPPRSRSTGCSSASGSVQVSGYMQSEGSEPPSTEGGWLSWFAKLGTYMLGYMRTAPLSNSVVSSRGSSASKSGERTRYTRSDGTEYTQSLPSTTNHPGIGIRSSSKSSGQRHYVDNAYNRKLGRVGKPLGTHIIHSGKSTGGPGERYYVDNAHNRRLGRVGKPKPQRGARQREIVEESTLGDLIQILQCMGFSDTCHQVYQSALDRLEREQIEECWKKDGVNSSTDTSHLTCFNTPGRIIPLAELRQKRLIGRGGFGEVYACLWCRQPVAFKKLFYQHMSRKRQDSFVKEITILATLDHPNIVRMLGTVVQEGNIGIVMEYLPRSLFQAIFIDCTEFPDARKKEIIRQMASALLYLHTPEPKIAHCDIKSENVLLDGNDNAKLGDFGLSAIKNATESSKSSVAGAPPGQGTPRYSAPEVLRGELLTMSQLFQTDIYSLGVVVFEVVAEEEPFEGLSVKQLEANVGHGNLRPTSTVTLSQHLSDLLNSSWDGIASKRPNAAEFSAQWNSISDLYI